MARGAPGKSQVDLSLLHVAIAASRLFLSAALENPPSSTSMFDCWSLISHIIPFYSMYIYIYILISPFTALIFPLTPCSHFTSMNVWLEIGDFPAIRPNFGAVMMPPMVDMADEWI